MRPTPYLPFVLLSVVCLMFISGCHVVTETDGVVLAEPSPTVFWVVVSGAICFGVLAAYMIVDDPGNITGYGAGLAVIFSLVLFIHTHRNNIWQIDQQGFTTPSLGFRESERVLYCDIAAVELVSLPNRKGNLDRCDIRLKGDRIVQFSIPDEPVKGHLLAALRLHGAPIKERVGDDSERLDASWNIAKYVFPAVFGLFLAAAGMAYVVRRVFHIKPTKVAPPSSPILQGERDTCPENDAAFERMRRQRDEDARRFFDEL